MKIFLRQSPPCLQGGTQPASRLGFLLVLVIGAQLALARNVDLSTVPNRDSVQLTIYNSEDLTLVRETRKVTFKKGANPLQFSWANTLIDPTSVELKFLTNAEKLEVLDTTFPQDKPAMLYWNVQSDFDGESTIEITYFTSGITWSADYTAIADKDETTLNLDSFVKVTNNSGEEYENAQIQLVVGTINLVEKIAQLANVSVDKLASVPPPEQRYYRKLAVQHALGGRMTEGRVLQQLDEKQIIKQGLSEYFIYTIEGTETIPNGWAKRMRSFSAEQVPFKVQYRYRPQEYGDQLVRMYLLTNDTTSKLGTTPLPNGTLRLFRGNGRDGLSYLDSQAIKYVAIGDKIELNLGVDPNVIFDLVKLKVSRDNIWMQVRGGRVFTRADQAGVQIDVRSTVAGWDEHQFFTQRIRNYSAKPIDVEIRRSFDGDVLFRSSLAPTSHDYRTAQFRSTVDAGKKSDLLFELVSHEGHNAKQSHVTLEAAEIKP
jgi:hypothetical protein